MPELLVGTADGCRVFCDGGRAEGELPGRNVGPFAAEPDGSCLAIVDQREIWRRSPQGDWSTLAVTAIKVQSLLASGGNIYAGGLEEATLLCLHRDGKISRVRGFEAVPGRSEWFAGGPPLGVRSLAAADDGKTLIAAVHVGGMPRSTDHGKTWAPTIPIMFDVHEVRPHPSRSNIMAAATAVGLCVSRDGGQRWDVIADGLDVTNSLAVAVSESEILFSVQEGPFARRSQVWRYTVNSETLEPVKQGLPEWLEGKVDTAQIATGAGSAALCDGGGNLWWSREETSDWRCIARGIGYANGLAILP